MNVCGLQSKLLNPDFITFVKKYDILLFQETKTDIYDKIDLPDGYDFKAKHRKKFTKKSGGMIIVFKKYLCNFIEFVDSDSDFVQWLILKNIFGTSDKNVLMGCVYIPPENTRYYSEDAINEIESEMFNFCKNDEIVCILGDFNAKTGTIDDYVKPDESLLDIFDLNEDPDLISYLYDYENLLRANLPLQRKSLCTGRPNALGHKLLDFCRKNNIYIINGRAGKDSLIGEKTCKAATVIDYCLCSSPLFNFITEFEIEEFSLLLSDVHRPVRLSLIFDRPTEKEASDRENRGDGRAKRWNADKCEDFLNHLTEDDTFAELLLMASELDEIGPTDSETDNENVNNIADKICQLFDRTAKNVFGTLRPKSHTKDDGYKPWIDETCKEKRKVFHNARKTYNRFKNEVNRLRLSEASKSYKASLNASFKKYQDNIADEMRTSSRSDPKRFWSILNRCSGKRKQPVEVSIQELYDYFRDMNDVDIDEPENERPVDEDVGIDNEILNASISQSEIEDTIQKLSNNKSSGIDKVTNEYIKYSLHVMMPIYHKLFNYIFDKGIVPESWSVGVITPIFKNKGSPKEPKNYRGITLMSCLGKVFTGILNNRLSVFAEEFNLISSSQAGFRKNHSTVDNIFILHSLINLYLSKKKTLYCTFIDFSRAFDTIWRAGLWKKLVKSNIQGKCLTVIQNLYQNVKSCVSLNGVHSDFFACNIGVRQGENLSPFLFSLFINDIEQYLEDNNVSSLEMINDISTDILENYLKIFLLLYADDTVLVSETVEGMQNMLNVFHEYCNIWKLDVNVDKTKVVIFTKRRNRENIKFKFNDIELSNCDIYNYLGICFSYNNSFVNAKKKLVEQAQKALYSVYYKIRNLVIPVDLQLKIFDTLIAPILLYASEVIGFEKNDNIEKVHLQFLKRILKVRTTTPNYLVYGEVGRYPLSINIKCRMLSYWNNLQNSNKLSSKFCTLLYNMNRNGVQNLKWIQSIKSIFDEIGLSFIFNDKIHVSPQWLKSLANQILRDQFIQKWNAELANTSRGQFYIKFKNEFRLEPYLLRLKPQHRFILTKFRLSNLKFPIETGRWTNIPRDNRICTKCQSGEVGDEYHYLFKCECIEIVQLRNRYIPSYYTIFPNEVKMIGLLKLCHIELLTNVCIFLKNIIALL